MLYHWLYDFKVYCIKRSHTQVYYSSSKITKCLRATPLCCEHIDVLICTRAECTMDKLWFSEQTLMQSFLAPVLMILWNAVIFSCMCTLQHIRRFHVYSFPLQTEWSMLINLPLLNLDNAKVWIAAVSTMYILRWLCHYKCFFFFCK